MSVDKNESLINSSIVNCTLAEAAVSYLCNGSLSPSTRGTGSGSTVAPSGGNFSFLGVEFAKVLYGIVCLVGLCGNSLVIYVVLRFSKMQTVTNMYIFNLALADEMFLIGLPFLIITVVLKYWPFGSFMCKLYMTTTSINQITSCLLLTVMSADRYVAVCHPISSPRYRTTTIAKFICCTVWSVSAFLMVPIFMYADVADEGKSNSCNIYWPQSEIMDGQKAFTLYSFTFGFFIPCILIFLFYFLVICKLRTVGPKNKSKEKKKSHRKVTYLVLTVITVYVLCWLPYWIGQVYIAFLPQTPDQSHSEAGLTFILLASCLSYANSAMNPILYAFLSENFKKSFAKAFTCAANKEVNAHLNVENSANPRTTRAGSSRGPNNLAGHSSFHGPGGGGGGGGGSGGGGGALSTCIGDDLDASASGDPCDRGIMCIGSNEKVALRQSLDVPHSNRSKRTSHDDDDELDDEEEEEIVELEDSPDAIPMTTRISSYVGSVMSNREQRITHDRQILIPSSNITAMKDPSTPL